MAGVQVNLLQLAQPLPVYPGDPGWLSARGGNGGPGGDASTPGGDGQGAGTAEQAGFLAGVETAAPAEEEGPERWEDLVEMVETAE